MLVLVENGNGWLHKQQKIVHMLGLYACKASNGRNRTLQFFFTWKQVANFSAALYLDLAMLQCRLTFLYALLALSAASDGVISEVGDDGRELVGIQQDSEICLSGLLAMDQAFNALIPQLDGDCVRHLHGSFLGLPLGTGLDWPCSFIEELLGFVFLVWPLFNEVVSGLEHLLDAWCSGDADIVLVVLTE